MTALIAPTTPSWRGRMHTWAFFASVPAVIALVARAQGASDRVAVAVYGACSAAAYGTSAAYHRLARSPRARAVMRRADHSTILLWIAGTYTAISVLALPGTLAAVLLAVIWVGAIAGCLLNVIAFDRTRPVVNALFMVLGWAAIIAAPSLVTHLTAAELALVVGGGVIYTAGAVMLWTGRPNPRPAVFGYHEVWHVCTIVAGTCHAGAVWLLAGSAA